MASTAANTAAAHTNKNKANADPVAHSVAVQFSVSIGVAVVSFRDTRHDEPNTRDDSDGNIHGIRGHCDGNGWHNHGNRVTDGDFLSGVASRCCHRFGLWRRHFADRVRRVNSRRCPRFLVAFGFGLGAIAFAAAACRRGT